MPQVKYIAQGQKVDSIRGVGLRWEPGQVRNVAPQVAELLLTYTDTWEGADESPVEPENSEEVALKTDEIPAEEPLPVIDFHAMDKKALVEFAETKYNEKMDKRWSESTIRHHVIALFGQHELDQG